MSNDTDIHTASEFTPEEHARLAELVERVQPAADCAPPPAPKRRRPVKAPPAPPAQVAVIDLADIAAIARTPFVRRPTTDLERARFALEAQRRRTLHNTWGPDGRIRRSILRGPATILIADRLKAAGGIWDARRQIWLVHPDQYEHLAGFLPDLDETGNIRMAPPAAAM